MLHCTISRRPGFIGLSKELAGSSEPTGPWARIFRLPLATSLQRAQIMATRTGIGGGATRQFRIFSRWKKAGSAVGVRCGAVAAGVRLFFQPGKADFLFPEQRAQQRPLRLVRRASQLIAETLNILVANPFCAGHRHIPGKTMVPSAQVGSRRIIGALRAPIRQKKFVKICGAAMFQSGRRCSRDRRGGRVFIARFVPAAWIRLWP